jgi:signal transduction histidine kinase
MTQDHLSHEPTTLARPLLEEGLPGSGRTAVKALAPTPPDDSAGNPRRTPPPDASGFTRLRVFHDKDGLPVTYDAATHKKMEEAKADAISVMSHELLSPLTLIKGYTSTLLELRNAITGEQQEKYLRGIEAASNRLVRLLENLRDITRLEETNSLIAQPVNVYDLLRTTAAEIQDQTTKHIIKLLPAARLPRVKLDPEKIIQVLHNLLNNAIKYSPQGGDIEVDVCLVQDEAEMERLFAGAPDFRLPALVVSIADSGFGIPEAELELIFEKFYRVNAEATRGISGAGLGLYICKMIVEAHGGRIWAGNRVQGGAVFSFSLPLDK